MPPTRVVIFGWAESAHIQRWVTGLQAQGLTVRLISLGGRPIKGVETIILPRTHRLSYLTQAKRAVGKAREFKPDLVHVHYAGGFGLWGLKCDFAPVLVSVWGSDIVDLPIKYLWRLLIRRVLKRATAISATSQMLKRTCADLVNGIEAKVTVIPFGVELPDPVPDLPPFPPRLCFIKGHRRKYGPEVLLQALAAAIKIIPDLSLTMAGAGELTPRLKAVTRRLGLEDRVEFCGFVPNERIYSLLARHHVMVMPSITEAFGVAALEASACGRAVIASCVGGVPEVVEDGRTGLLIEPNDVNALTDAIVELAGDWGRCAQMGREGHNFVAATYTWARSLEQMMALYRKVGDEKSSDTPV